MGQRVKLPECPHEVRYSDVKKNDRMVVSMLGYTCLYRIASIETAPCCSIDDETKLESRSVAKTKSGLVVCLHTGNVLSWRTNGYELMPRAYFVGSPYRGRDRCSSAYAPGER